ncbi:NAD-binding protein [Fomitopsis schrenkii]|uniref:NAD-binding protein n=1 Tax=Fomitopsis schrenkii TaxID=2126942 RepID=S8EEE0_FOMSC|nr:NAD-binding protein [Fomitopsis schrenkii]
MSQTTAVAIKPHVAIITGAAQGIGRSIALRLAQDGLSVAINDIPAKSAQIDEVVAEIKAAGGIAVAAPADVTDEDAVQKMIANVVEKLGGLDVMVANAGVMSYGPLLMVPTQEWDRVLNINLRGVMLCYKYAAKQMVEQGRGGRIIGMPYTSAYAASKFAIRGLTQALAAELTRYNITVNVYAPGGIRTGIGQCCPCAIAYSCSPLSLSVDAETAKASGIVNSDLMKMPVAEPEVIASLVSYIAKPEAYFITGQTISANGGAHFD